MGIGKMGNGHRASGIGHLAFGIGGIGHLRAVPPADLGAVGDAPYPLPGAVCQHRHVAMPRLDVGLVQIRGEWRVVNGER